MVKILDKFNTLVDAPDLAKLLLRVVTALLLIMHGWSKITGEGGLSAIVRLLGAIGLPAFLAPTIYIAEILAPILLIFGILVRPAAFVIFIAMVVAWLTLYKSGIAFDIAGGAFKFEPVYLFLSISLALVFMGCGKYSIVKERWR